MKTLEEIQDEVAKENNYPDTDYILVKCGPMFTKSFIDIVAKRYAEQAIERCAEVSNDLFDADDILKVKEELK